MKLKSNMFTVVFTLSCGVQLGLAATRTVSSLADDGSAGTLRSVINSAAAGDVINFAVNGTITLTLGTIEINKNLTISGINPASTVINGNHLATVFQIDPGASVSIFGVTIENGTACTSFSCNGSGGGGIRNAGTLFLDYDVISGNSTGCNCNAGGGILNSGALFVTTSTFSGNSAAYGGAIAGGGTLTVTNSTFSGNGAAYGGGINAANGSVTFSTFYQNGSNFDAPAIVGGGSLVIKAVVFGNNNFVDGVGNPYAPGSCTGVVSAGYNLADDSECSSSLTQSSDLNNTPAGLDPAGLKNNGGPTPTVALVPGSAAIDAIPINPTNECTIAIWGAVSDQRGMPRPQGLACDIGAFEIAADNDSGFAQLTGGNNLSGNQNVTGTVAATAFIGDGSGLTGVVAASANTANLANFATSAGDAATLGGFPASAFAPVSGSPNYVAKTGDTMTGALNLPTDGLIAGGNEFVLTGGNVGIGTTTPQTYPGYRSLHIDNAVAGFGGAFLELSHSPTGAMGRVVADDNGFLLNGLSPTAPVKIRAGGTFNGANDPGNIYVTPSGNVGINTGTPAAMLEVNGTAKFDGTVTFAPGQTFPGSGGTITGVTAGTGLSGGGASGSVSLTNTGLLSLTAGTGINSTGGQTPTLSLNTSFSDARYAQLGTANIFTAPQAVNASPNATAFSASGNYGLWGTGVAAGVYGVSSNNVGVVGISGTDTGVVGNGGIRGVSGSGSITGVAGVSGSGSGILGTATATAGTAGTFNSIDGAKILSGQNSNTEVFSIDSNGNLKTSASLTGGSLLAGSAKIGGGTPITGHLSMTFSLSLPSLKPSTCTTSTFTFAGASDGDTTALGVPNALMSPGMIIYSAWVSAANTVTIRACNVNPNGPAATAASGTVRVDIWKH